VYLFLFCLCFFIFHPGVLDVPGAISLPHPMRQERTLFIIVL
jgi:hypothetical protein